jgi:UDP-N-acetylglucosamine--N-acetylmuramyl-(pentapeptide) pyrophosphoryl-undecaprenol N-acetylglucosamine transferase
VAARIAEQMPDVRITFAGGGKPLDRGSVASAGYDYLALLCRPMPRGWLEVPAALWQNLQGYLAARRWLRRQPCAVVVGLGGYASAATARAAIACRIPLVLLEQNVIPGRVTRWLAGRAAVVCLAFEQARSRLAPGCRTLVTGNPIRPGFDRPGDDGVEPGDGPIDSVHRPRRLLILGGSSGARALNRSVPQALARIRSRLAGWEIVHQSGEAEAAATGDLYRDLGLAACVAPFVTDMPGMLAATDLAICRAGGTTLAELTAAGVPALLVPYPHAADDHQRRNADALARHGACRLIDERETVGIFDQRLADALASLLADCAQRARMAAAMRPLARPSAAADVAVIVARLARSRRPSPRRP